MDNKNSASTEAIEETLETFFSYGWIKEDLSDEEKMLIKHQLKTIARAGFADAQSLLWNSSLKF